MDLGDAVKKLLIPRCYVGGEHFALVALSQDVDRVFIAHSKCSEQMGDDAIKREVRTIA